MARMFAEVSFGAGESGRIYLFEVDRFRALDAIDQGERNVCVDARLRKCECLVKDVI